MLQKAIGINADSFLAAANPTHDKDGKRRFLVIERFFPNGERGTFIAALGGHSLPVISPPDHYQFGIELLTQLEPLVYNTEGFYDLTQRGPFLLRIIAPSCSRTLT